MGFSHKQSLLVLVYIQMENTLMWKTTYNDKLRINPYCKFQHDAKCILTLLTLCNMDRSLVDPPREVPQYVKLDSSLWIDDMVDQLSKNW